jgi:hypothetical protein
VSLEGLSRYKKGLKRSHAIRPSLYYAPKKCMNTLYPPYTPTIPITPDKTGGAGIGSLNSANTNPTIPPVINDNNISLMLSPSFS